MPPQPGVFALPYASTHKARANNASELLDMTASYHQSGAPSTSRAHGMFNAGLCSELDLSSLFKVQAQKKARRIGKEERLRGNWIKK